MLTRAAFVVHAVFTSDEPHASTDARVSLVMYGVKDGQAKRTPRIALQNPSTAARPFQRDQADDFELQTTDVGELQRIRIMHNGHAAEHGWHLRNVRVTHLGTGERALFICGQWLGKAQGDGETMRELVKHGSGKAAAAAAELAQTKATAEKAAGAAQAQDQTESKTAEEAATAKASYFDEEAEVMPSTEPSLQEEVTEATPMQQAPGSEAPEPRGVSPAPAPPQRAHMESSTAAATQSSENEIGRAHV